MNQIIIFTDLDGTLLDEENYSFSAAKDAIDILIERKIPIVPCTSKTHLEVIGIQKKIGISGPFIVENGSAIFFPNGYFTTIRQPIREFDGFHSLMLGSEYKDILNFFNLWRKRYSLTVTGIHELPIERLMKITALNSDKAEIARKRFFSEPFILNDDRNLSESAVEDIRSNGYRLLIGNRFYHLLGNTDKGTAIKKLLEMFKQKWETDTLFSVGIGDSMNDLEMFKAVDKPVLVKKPGMFHQPGIKGDNLLYTDGIGPAGWQEAIYKILNII